MSLPIKDGVITMRPEGTNLFQGLHDFSKEHSGGVLVEVGAYAGEATAVFAQYFDTVLAIDPWENGYDKKDGASQKSEMKKVEKSFDRRTKSLKNVVKLKTSSEEAVKDIEDESIDVVYIDGLHTYKGVKKDITMWYPKVKPKGIIAGHDFTRNWMSVFASVIDTIGIPDKDYIDTTWVVKKGNIQKPRFLEVENG